MADRKIQANRVDHTVLGRAARETGYAYVLTPRVIDCANRLAIDRAELLGLVIAHEVGHLVLPVHSHSTIGIMRADLDLSATLLASLRNRARRFGRSSPPTSWQGSK